MAQYDLILTQNIQASGIDYQEKIVNIAKGGLLSASAASEPTVLAAGTNGYVLIRDDAEVTGLKWIDPSTFGGSSNVSVTNQANNRVVTATATTDVLNAESGLTYDGSVLSVTGSITQSTVRILSGASNAFTYNATTQDVRIGVNAGNDAMTHTCHSVLVGSNTGYNMTTAEGCVFIGYYAGQIVSTGSYNVGIGPYALNRTTTGTQNVAIGAHALRNFTGVGNVGIGYGAGMGVSGSSTGNYNMFLGASAGSGVTTGSTNVIIGASAGTKITTGGNNTFIGGTAGQFNTGSYNTFIGVSAGKGVDGSSTGGNNVFVGALAGQDVTTGQYNLLIGYHVDPSSATATYDFRLGYDTTFLLQGNMAAGSQWVGTDYIFRTDYVSEFTTSAGVDIQSVLKLSGIASATTSYVLYYNTSTDVVTYGAAPSGGSTYWSKSGTNLSPLTVGDDVLLPNGDKVSWDDGNTYIAGSYSGTQYLNFYVSSTRVFWLSQDGVWVFDPLRITDDGASPWSILNTAGDVSASHSIMTGGTGSSLTWSGGESSSVTATHYGGNLILKGGNQTGTGGGHGGNVYIYGGSSVSAARGDVFFGTGSAGYLPAKSSETNVVFYNTSTGKLSYGTASGSGNVSVSGTPVANQVAIWTNASTIKGETGLTWSSGILSTNSGVWVGVGAPNGANGLYLEYLSLRINYAAVMRTFLAPSVADNGGGSSAYLFDTALALTDTYIARFASAGTSRFYITGNGAVYAPSLASGTSAYVLYYNTTSGQISYGTPSGGSIDGSGAATRIAYWSDANTLTSSANLVFDGNTLTIAQGILVSAPTVNQTASGVKTTLTAGEALSFGQMVYMKSDGKVWKASATGLSTTPVLGMCINTVAADGSAVILLMGRAYNSSWSLGSGGPEIYLTTTAGGFSVVAPSGVTGYVVQVLGVVLSATTIYFNPSLNQTVLA